MKKYLWAPAVALLAWESFIYVLVARNVAAEFGGWAGFAALLVGVVPLWLGVAGAYLYGCRVGLRAGYVKGGDDMLERVLV